jgi:glycine/D-amino acid oxidase-like deaminating enzyme/nitrite reductase/ring-hydroxylating ferredoxin subunit
MSLLSREDEIMKPSVTSEHTCSVWMSIDMPTCAALSEDIATDVCIIGSGIAGLTTAYHLLQEGKSVVVLESGTLGSGMTPLTTAHLSHVMDRGLSTIERLHGEQGARVAVQSHTAAIEWIEKTAAAESIACDFERMDGYLFAPSNDSAHLIEEEWETARRIGQTNVTRYDSGAPLPFSTGPYLRFTRQAQFHPMKYLSGLARALTQKGGRLFTNSHVTEVDAKPRAMVTTRNGWHVSANAVVVTTNTPINNTVTLHTKQAPYTTYVIGASISAGSVPKALYWDTEDPYHYVRVHMEIIDSREEAMLIVGGEDHKTGQAEDGERRYAALETWMRARFPMAKNVLFSWAGQVMESIDGLAYIGRNPGDSNVYVATGDSGMGITHGTIAGLLLSDLIMRRSSPWASLYDPSRQSIKAAGTFLSESLNVAAQYGDWLTPGDVASEQDIPVDGGAVLRNGLHKIAAYRDSEGVLHQCSAVCPHLSCIVAWNPSQKTWDCPCHGSRFDRFGKVLNGPATSDLSPLPDRSNNSPS